MRLTMYDERIHLEKKSTDFILMLLSMTYVTLVILSIILFDEMIKKKYFGLTFNLSGAVVPYVFLYPISFIVLRIYGFKQVNNMIGSMTIVSLFFVLFSKFVISLSSNDTGVHQILANSLKMYLAGFIGMPIGIYSSFLCLNTLLKIGLNYNLANLIERWTFLLNFFKLQARDR